MSCNWHKEDHLTTNSKETTPSGTSQAAFYHHGACDALHEGDCTYSAENSKSNQVEVLCESSPHPYVLIVPSTAISLVGSSVSLVQAHNAIDCSNSVAVQLCLLM